MNRTEFYYFHPLPLFLFFIFVLLLTMLTFNPVLLLTSLLGALSFDLFVNRSKLKAKNFVIYPIIFTAAALTNPLFSHNGMTVLFYMGDNAVTMESFYYGMNIALMIIAVMIWCKNYSLCVTQDKFLYLFSKPAPKAALILSCAVRFIPLFELKYRQISDAQKGLGMYDEKKGLKKLKLYLAAFSALVTWSLEKSAETADSMRSRGYGLKGKTSFSPFSFRKRDLVLLILSATLFAISVTGTAANCFEFSFYPLVTYTPFTALGSISYISFVLLVFTPFIIEVKENLVWKFFVSKI